ncbi:MAG: hypothetical protein ABIY90_09760 [Puia sp.]
MTILSENIEYLVLVEALQKKDPAAFSVFYDRYAAAFYGDIKRAIYKQAESDAILEVALCSIWKSVGQFDPEQEHLFTWALKKVRKEISRVKVDMVLKAIFACQQSMY